MPRSVNCATRFTPSTVAAPKLPRAPKKASCSRTPSKTGARAWAAGVGGCEVERTSTDGGSLGREALVGDLVVVLADGGRVVIEAKHTARITLTGPDGILAELDRAMTNRDAEVAICVSAQDAFPGEVGWLRSVRQPDTRRR